MNNNTKHSTIEIERLSRLAEHLRKNKLYEKIDRSSISVPLRLYQNGSVIRYFDFPFFECTHIFKEWIFTSDGLPVLDGITQPDIADSAMDFFNLDCRAFRHLFSPEAQDCDKFGGRMLERNATEKEVAYNIRCFLERVH